MQRPAGILRTIAYRCFEFQPFAPSIPIRSATQRLLKDHAIRRPSEALAPNVSDDHWETENKWLKQISSGQMNTRRSPDSVICPRTQGGKVEELFHIYALTYR